MGFNCGIVGLPNVGKSTLFNALTATASAEAANYPFCTIEPNSGRVGVPDERLTRLAKIADSKQTLPTQLEFTDIAGLVKGASKGEGLGNQFLGHIRSVDAIIHVLRCFEDTNITHVEGSVDPLRDMETIETELMLADIESLERRQENLGKKIKGGDKEAKEVNAMIEKVLPLLQEGKPARAFTPSQDEKKTYDMLQLLTSKPILYVCNVGEDEAGTGNEHTEAVKKWAEETNAQVVIISAAIEAEVAQLESEEEKKEFLAALGLEETGLNKIIREGYKLLDLVTYFTVGPKEARAWTITRDTSAPKAAGVIHTDFERGFICADVIAYKDYVEYGGEQEAKNSGKLRSEGKEYIVKDGDVMHFKFNV